MREVEIERLLQWAYREELPKRGVVGTLSNQWDNLSHYGALLTVIDDEPRMPAALGPPHPDALTIERAVEGLPEKVKLTWFEFGPLLMGDVLGLMPKKHPLGERAFSERAMIETFARMGQSPTWNTGLPTPHRILGKNNKPVLIGESKGVGRYSPGSCCPLQYSGPTVEQLVHRRSEYVIWHGALKRVLGTLKGWLLRDHVPTAPTAPALPWLDAAAGPAPKVSELDVTTPAWRTWRDAPSVPDEVETQAQGDVALVDAPMPKGRTLDADERRSIEARLRSEGKL